MYKNDFSIALGADPNLAISKMVVDECIGKKALEKFAHQQG